MKSTKLIIIATLSLMSISSFGHDYENFGNLPEDIYQKQNEANVESLVAQSRELRKSMATNRNIASFTAEEEYWAHEFDKLMADPTDKNYLKMAEKL